MRLLGRILAIVAGVGAAVGAVLWAKNNVTFSVRKMTEEEETEEEARVAEYKAEVDEQTAAEIEAAGDDAVAVTLARIKGWVRKLASSVEITKGEDELANEGEHTEGSQTPEDGAAEPPVDAPAPEDGGPNANPVDAQPAEPEWDEDGKLDATKLASPEDFADWDDLGCQG